MIDIIDLAIVPIIIPETIQEEAEEAEGVAKASGSAVASGSAGPSGSAGASGSAIVTATVDDTAGAWGFQTLDLNRLAQEQKDDDNQMIQLIDLLEAVRFDPSKFKKHF